MQALFPILACYGMGLALLFARGGERDPLASAALALPVGAAASAVLAFALSAAGLPLPVAGYGAAWGAVFGAAAFVARRELGRLWPAPAAFAAAIALLALAFSRIDVVVLSGASHDALLEARILAAGGDGPGGLAASLHAAFFLVAGEHLSALVPVLALSAVVALGVLVARAAEHPRRVPLAVLAALTVATSFPLLRSLLTVGSPAAAGIFLLAAGGLWYLAERAGDSRPLPLALVLLLAFALQGGRFAAGAILFAAVLAAGTRLTRRGLAWRHRAARLHPALCLLVAALLAGIPRAVGVGVAGPLLALAPLLLFAVIALAASRDTAPDLAPGEPAVTRADLATLAVAWLAGAAVVSALEWALLNAQVADRFAGLAQRIRLLPLGFGNLLPYALAACLLLLAADLASRHLAARLRFHRLAVAGAAALLAAPYAIWLARYTFSGPQAQEMAHHQLYVAAAALFIAGAAGAAIWFAVLRRDWQRWRPVFIVALVAGAAAALVASRAVLVNEYEPLHQFLGALAILLAALAGREIAGRVGPPRRAAALAIAAAAWTLASGVVLARDHGDAWLVWGETGASRYLTRRWSFLTPAADLDAVGARMIVKPELESPPAAALRAERAAAPAPNIILFSVDGMRRDRVGAYGHRGRPLTPNIDRFAARGVRFTRAFSSFPATQVFNSALLLGRFVDRSSGAQQPPSYRVNAITNLLKQRDYHTFVKSWFEQSLSNRFDARPYHFDTYVPKAKKAEHLEEPMQEGLARLAAHVDQAKEKGRPIFVWMHLLATHPMKGQGFRPDPDFAFGDGQMDRYESALAGSDRWLAGVEELVEKRLANGRPTIWVILADHGVNTHTRSRDLYENIVRVPFIIVAPGVAPRVDDRPIDVSLDLAATVVDWAGIAPPAEYDGVSLVPLLAGLPAEAMADRIIPLAYVGDWTGAVHRDVKYLRHKDVMSLFDLAADPGEKQNLIGQDFDRAHAMRAMADGELERRLRAVAEARDGP